jgi:ATP-independent RNA helicase DbpA
MNSQASHAAPGFDALPLPPATLQNLARLGYTAMTPIQAAALPLALAGHDLLAQARTGSGKTATFALALLARLGADPQKRSPMGALAVQALVLCPTRELADQVTQEIRRLAAAEDNIKVLTLCGGSPMRPQLASLEHGAHVVVGTPGRLMDHLERGSLDLAALNTLVLDEADRMLDMGFFDDITTVVKQCPKQRQTLLFSATYPEGIAKLAAAFLREPKEVKIAAPAPSVAAAQIQQRFVQVSEEDRLHTVGLLLDHVRPARTLAFCNTKQQCRDLVAVLRAQGLVALELHGDLEQRDRDQVLVQFSNGSASVLVATDIAARGLDIVGLEAVVNVDVSPDVATHTHRVGRTGRMSAEGQAEGAAYTLASLDEMGRVGAIEQAGGFSSQWLAVDSLVPSDAGPLVPAMATVQILGGRKEKIRAGDVLGALTKDMGFASAQVGKINVNEFSTYVAVARGVADAVVRKLNAGKVKGKSVKARRL